MTGANSIADANVAVAFVEAPANAALVGVGKAPCTSENMRIIMMITIPIIPAVMTSPPAWWAAYFFCSFSSKDMYTLYSPAC